ncbi:LysM peptidoglycan-binding domain-containing protein [Mycolicibacillus parakoreensis]|uniref:LysM peptidoglycan-binding domain-containing protein n=1 Tax=Mycolicibacillus parakoreensis TaxID=1069221 RepID=A0ABY3TY87_9MYCO|nr:LysM peptidoglycan-binding domain-containing protein [Mycolicibacillus parakoreensis]MCV7317204.1 LysM peptidoglycan-binding domain-containing protein [Mycolicibacillus parakoreensis]ULN51583.1 LysM peptidoglycan-binding domain-containing protein [Mycolicibacillus parakoreensis]HLR99864.1 LysM peptidoglycan-binding domain-containing protein [Mycolicibacillus parakoreensis]
MTVIDHRMPITSTRRAQPVRVDPGGQRRACAARRRAPHPTGPGPRALSYRGTGVRVSRAPHRRRAAVTPVTTVMLALVAAMITVWLGIVAQFGAAVTAGAQTVPAELAVVRVQSGESLQQLARRVAPGSPAAPVVAAIRDLNDLDSTAVQEGQTLIAPVG